MVVMFWTCLETRRLKQMFSEMHKLLFSRKKRALGCLGDEILPSYNMGIISDHEIRITSLYKQRGFLMVQVCGWGPFLTVAQLVSGSVKHPRELISTGGFLGCVKSSFLEDQL